MSRTMFEQLERRRLLNGLPRMSIADATITEGDSGTAYAAVVVSLSEPRPNQPVTVNYATQNGTATAGSDFTTASGKLTFAVGEISKTILLPVKGDQVIEPDETFLVNLNSAKQAKIADGQAVVTIVDDDPQVSIADATADEGHAGSSVVNVNVSLSSAHNQAVTVNYATADGSAIAGADYTAATGSVTFAVGETSKTIPVSVLGDRIGESDKYFLVNLTPGTNAKILDSQATVSITDDEPRISITGVYDYEGNAGATPFLFTVNLSRPYDQTVTVGFATSDYSAIAGTDYVGTSGTVTFIAGDTSETVSVLVNGNLSPEPQKDFAVTLSGASANSSISSGTAYGSIADDDGYVDPYYYDYGYYDYGYYGYYDYGYYYY